MTGNLDGGEGPPKTPYAFQSKKKRKQDKDKEDSIATTSTGFTKVNEVTNKEINALKKFIRDFDKMFLGNDVKKAITVNYDQVGEFHIEIFEDGNLFFP